MAGQFCLCGDVGWGIDGGVGEDDRERLFRIRQQASLLFPRFTTIIAQPGLSIGSASDEQLRLIAGAASYVQTVTKGGFEVYGSD